MDYFKLDEHPGAGTALISDATLSSIRYVPIEEAARYTFKEIAAVYLKQAHYVAGVKACGLFIAAETPVLPGWVQYDEKVGMLEGMQRKHGKE
jgi:hypothetical protein